MTWDEICDMRREYDERCCNDWIGGCEYDDLSEDEEE